MKNDSVIRLKKYLEAIYDIPFDVNGSVMYKDSKYDIKPQNSNNELFNIDVKVKNELRLVIDVTPQKYAAFSIKDMSEASEHQKKIFLEYAKQLSIKKAKTDFYINDVPCDINNTTEWPSDWNSYRLRVSRSPVCAENEEFNEFDVVSRWTAIIIGMILSLLNVIRTEDEKYYEGGIQRIEINKYERNPVNRELCLISNGYTCKVCGFNFERKYGELGRNFIHVHHIVPVSEMKESYEINPVTDMIPVCPNCHAMLHRVTPPLTPDELIEIIKDNEMI